MLLPPDRFTARERDALRAIIDGFLTPGTLLPDSLAKHGAAEACEKVILGPNLDGMERLNLRLLLCGLSTSLGTALLTLSPGRNFAARSPAECERLLLRLGTSPIGLHRYAFLGLKRLVLSVCATYYQANGSNPVWRAAGYPGAAPVEAGGSPAELPSAFGSQPAEGLSRLECDVVIVGSGCGGGVSAALLSQAGLDVVVLDKGAYVAPKEVSGRELDAFEAMYEKGGLLVNTDGSIGVLAGATLGGGTTVNWACCLPPPEYVREEWAKEHGLAQFASGAAEFEASLQAILTRIGATDARDQATTSSRVALNAANAALLDGADRLGYPRRVTGQNLRDTKAATAGWTSLGDRQANKQGSLSTWLSDAVAKGAKVYDRIAVDKVLVEQGRAVGVRATRADGTPLEVRAKAIVLAAGSLHSPCVLLRSGVGGAHVGRHLRLHPVTGLTAHFERDIKVYEGAPMTSVCDVCEQAPDGSFYGAKLEIPSVHPGLMCAAIGWRGGAEFARDVTLLNRSNCMIVLQRDGGDGGRVSLDASGKGPCVRYRLREADAASMLEAMDKGSRVLVAAGAMQVATVITGHPAHPVAAEARGQAAPGANAPLDAWVASFKAAGLRPNGVGLFSAHQMGTCRMGTDASTSVVDLDGEVWDADGLFVIDASIFPTASGANPMVTTLAISHMLATRLAARLSSGFYAASSADVASHGAAAVARQTRREVAKARRLRTKQARSLGMMCVAVFLANVYFWWQVQAQQQAAGP